jgi:transposase
LVGKFLITLFGAWLYFKSDYTKILIKEAGCQLLFLPPYSPYLNSIEKFWANLKVRVKKVITGFSTLAEAVDAAFKMEHLNFK